MRQAARAGKVIFVLRLTFCLSLLPFQALLAQASVPPAELARKPYVIEHLYRATTFQLDGTSRTTLDVRIRIQSTAAVNQFGQLSYAYSSANQRLDVDFVRVLKSGGDTVVANVAAVQDVTAPVAQQAPMYSDLHQKVVTVPALQAGDTLEFHLTWTTETPFAPGNFWDWAPFTRAAIVQDERISYDVPRQAHVQVKTEGGPDPIADRQQVGFRPARRELDFQLQPLLRRAHRLNADLVQARGGDAPVAVQDRSRAAVLLNGEQAVKRL